MRPRTRTAAALIAEIAIPTGMVPVSVNDTGTFFNVLPNQAHEFFIIRNARGLSGIRIIDIYGRTSMRLSPSHESEIVVPTANLEPGVFFLVSEGDGMTVKKLVIW